MKMGKEIARKCGGVPLVAKVIGAMLRGEGEGKWMAVKENDLWNLVYEDEDLHPGLRLSYFYLPPFLKRCFEYFALFPSDFKFNGDDLVRMWMSEGLIEVKEGIEPEEIESQYYNDLKGRSLIQENDMMHAMVHHLACIVSGRFFFQTNSGSRSSTSSLQSVRHASIKDKPESLVDADKLRTLIHSGDSCHEVFSYKMLRVLELNSVSDLPSSIGCDLQHLRYLCLRSSIKSSDLPDSICRQTNLQVLDLSCRDLQKLPQDLGKLSNLRYLRLSEAKMTSLPDSVCSLSNLRVLNLSYCRCLTTLPNDIGNLQRLQKLKITSEVRLPESIVNATNLDELNLWRTNQPAHLGKLTKLENLDCYRVGKEKGQGIDELKDMNKLKGCFVIKNIENIESVEAALMADLKSKKHIETLNFSWEDSPAPFTGRDGEMEVRVMEALEPNAVLKCLSFQHYIGRKFPSWMSSTRFHNLTSLIVLDSPMVTAMEGMVFQSLKVLTVENCPALRAISMTTPKLESLTVVKCKVLKLGLLQGLGDTLWNLECDYFHLDIFLQQLKATTASPCTKLGNLTIHDLPPKNFKIAAEEYEKLLESISGLSIRHCPDLVSLKSLQLPLSLERLNICDCSNLTNLPSVLRCLSSLQDIRIFRCPNLEIGPNDLLPPSVLIDVGVSETRGSIEEGRHTRVEIEIIMENAPPNST